MAENVIYVSPSSTSYKNIVQALNDATEKTRIIVDPGLYTKPLKLTKPGVTIEAKEMDGNVQISVAAGPAISVNFKEKGEPCKLHGIKIIHTGASSHTIHENPNDATHDSQSQVSNASDHTRVESWLNSIEIHDDMSWAILVLNGAFICDEVAVSMNNTKISMPAVVWKHGNLTMQNSDIKGHSSVPTLGVYLHNANLALKNCKVYRHRGGGIMLRNKHKNIVHVFDCEIAYNANFGVICDGFEGKPMIEKCKIARNQGSGIKVEGDNKACIKQNDIRNNEDGILVKNSDPNIYSNSIYHNFGNGVNLQSVDDFSCEGKLESNDIFENQNGVIASGQKWTPMIANNSKIAHNRVAGIRVDGNASIIILRNDIFENVAQGILLVDGSHAKIERNNIYGNLKANIAYGCPKKFGEQVEEVIIKENNIYQGRCEGIFILAGGKSKIQKNVIYENTDGIISDDSMPYISMNNIYFNRRAGIIAAGNSDANIIENEVHKNGAVGINFRNKSQGRVLRNSIHSNPIQVSITTEVAMNTNEIESENDIIGEV